MNLLYPDGIENTNKLSAEAYKDLAVDEILDSMIISKEDREIIKDAIMHIPNSAETIRYRQDIIKDLISDDELCKELETILKSLNVLQDFKNNNRFRTVKKASLWELIDYMQEMDLYIQIVEALKGVFEKYEMKSKGLNEISELLKSAINMDKIDNLKEIISGLKSEVSGLKSVKVGINLSGELRPEEVFVLEYSTLPIPSPYEKTSWAMSLASKRTVTYRAPTPFMKHIAEDMEKELSKSVQNYKKELKNYVNFSGYFLLDICNDLKFYLLMAKFGRKLQDAGNTISFPMINENSANLVIKGVYNIRLTNKGISNIVKNDFEFQNGEKIFILTGPNRGGKTILTQAVGLTTLFASLGLFVTADSYEGFPIDGVLTHFPADENETMTLGRLGEEAVRIQEIVKEATNHTLVLLNETYSSTSAEDGLYLARDLVHILKYKDIPCIFNTHIHELARNVNQMNEEFDGPGKIVSLSMEIQNNVNTYRILRKEPDHNSYAHNIALKYGVTFDQMKEL
ncbi:MAG: hypothetical protein MJ166_07665 [Clostridia bacterium]|nr:hypothetical protein [Clostridia bacterium]